MNFLLKEKNKYKVSSCSSKILAVLVLNMVAETGLEFLPGYSSLPLVDIRLCFSVIG
jgi:hypothetical protein